MTVPDPDLPLEEPDEAVRTAREAEVELLGLSLPGPGLSDEEPRAVNALPLAKRAGGGFLWTQDRWRARRVCGPGEFTNQYPMRGMATAYWVGRADGVIEEGRALAWRASEEACEP